MDLKKLTEQVLANAESASDPEGIPDVKATLDWLVAIQMLQNIARSIKPVDIDGGTGGYFTYEDDKSADFTSAG